MHLDLSLGKRHLALFLGSIAALVVLAATPQLLGDRVGDGLRRPRGRCGGLDLACGAAFAGSVAGLLGCGWRSALKRCGGSTTRADAAARYCIGSRRERASRPRESGPQCASRSSPARCRTKDGSGRLAASRPRSARSARSGSRSCSPWAPRAARSRAGRIALLLLGVARRGRRRLARARSTRPGSKSHTLSTSSACSAAVPAQPRRSPAGSGSAMVLRIAAATAIAAAFGVEQPLVAALLIVPALDLAGILPLTPGNIGVASAAVAFALKAHGVVGGRADGRIAFGAVETLTTSHSAAEASLLRRRRTAVRRWRPPRAHRCLAWRRVRRDRARPAPLAGPGGAAGSARRASGSGCGRERVAERTSRPARSRCTCTAWNSGTGSRRFAVGTRACRPGRTRAHDPDADDRSCRRAASLRTSGSRFLRPPVLLRRVVRHGHSIGPGALT